MVEPPVHWVVVKPLGNGDPVQAHGPDGLEVQADGLQLRERHAYERDHTVLLLETALELRVLLAEALGVVKIAGPRGTWRAL